MDSPRAGHVALQKVIDVIDERGQDYGDPNKNFSNIAKGWSVLLGVDISPRQISQCMIWTKLCRDFNKPTQDNILDILGYGALMAEVSDEPVNG